MQEIIMSLIVGALIVALIEQFIEFTAAVFTDDEGDDSGESR